MSSILEALHDSAYGAAVREIFWLFPVLEIVHFMSLCVLFGAILFVDLRLLGFNRAIPIKVALRFIPLAIAGFVGALISGMGFFCNSPMDYWPNPSFKLKMLMLVVAGANALWFAFTERRAMTDVDPTAPPSLNARISAGLSLITWLIVIVCGRLLPYTGTSA